MMTLVAAAAANVPAGAMDLGALLHPAYAADPLHVDPPLLRIGSVLPGDAQPVPCAQATRDFTPELSLADAVDIALCGNPTVQAAWAGIKEQASAVGVAKAAYLPSVNGALSGLSDHTWYPDGGGTDSMDKGFKSNAALVWRLLDFGERDANLGASRHLLAAAVATHDATLQQTMASVIQAYFDAETAQAALVARQQEESIAASTLETAQRKKADGKGSEDDVLQAQTRLAHARLGVSRAVGSLGKSKAVVAYALGAPPGTTLTLSSLAPPRTGELGRSLADWLSVAQQHHPSIEAAREQVAAAQAQAQVVRSQGLPTLDFKAAVYDNGRPSQMLGASREAVVGMTLTVPLFEGFGRQYKVQGADAAVEERAAELHKAELRVGLEVVEAYSDATAALKNLDASDALLKTAWASLDSAQRKYQKSSGDVLDMLDSQKALADAQEERIRCLSEWHSASLRIMAAAGQLGIAELDQ